MISTADFKRGVRLEIDGEPYALHDYTNQSPSARGGNTLVKTKLRNLRTGQLIDKTFKSGERIKIPDFEIRDVQYLYDEGGETHYFMDTESYEQFGLHVDSVKNELAYLRPNDPCRALVYNGDCIGIEVPHTVTLEVTETEPGARGDTVSNATKSATLETGLEVQVPLFVNSGEKIIIDTREQRYVKRA